MRTALRLPLALVLVALLAIPAGAAATITPVVKTNADEWGPAAGSGGITWNRYTKSDAWVNADAGSGIYRVNSGNTWAWNGSIEGNVLTYQQANRRGSDIVRYDIVAQSTQAAPSYVNSKWWEYLPTESGPWVLFARTNVGYGVKREWRQLLLVNTITAEKRVLAKGPGRMKVWPGQVNGLWAVWSNCAKTGCVVYRHDITGDVTTKVPQGGPHQYSPAVSQDGTMYYVRGNTGCGKNVSVIRRAPDGTESTLYSFPNGIDAEELYMYDGATHDLYLQDVDCAHHYNSDIYKITGADTAAPIVSAVAAASGGSEVDVGAGPLMTLEQEAAARIAP